MGPESVPADDAPWSEVARFARTFNAYDFHGSFAAVGEIANQRRCNTLVDLRTCLFFEQRRWNHFGTEPDSEAFAYIQSIVREIRQRVEAGSP